MIGEVLRMLGFSRCEAVRSDLNAALSEYVAETRAVRKVALDVVDESIRAPGDLSESATMRTIGRLVAQQRQRMQDR